uniref:Uncharacterized protein n=1 Tax=Tanacetum cinerariifolium TaxID=118510 RepID=A0A6L2KL30_TANCI|nr:hypothetical protein [Tanacetum cinerariifolium]
MLGLRANIAQYKRMELNLPLKKSICLTQAFRSHFLLKEDRKKLKVEKEGSDVYEQNEHLFPGVNLVRSILREKKDGNEWEDWSSLFISRKELVSTSLIRRTRSAQCVIFRFPEGDPPSEGSGT